MLKKSLIVLGLLFVALQFVRPAKNVSPEPGPHDLMVNHPPPPEVRQLLTVACYDCHSNHTRYPWYAHLQPLGWWLAQHVEDGKRELNLSTIGNLPPRRAARRVEAMIDELVDGNMPLKSYTWTHFDARLTQAQVDSLVDWLEELKEQLEDHADTQ